MNAGSDAGRPPSLLQQGWSAEVAQEKLRTDDAERSLRTALEAAYSAFLDGERNSAAFEVLCRQMAKAAEDFPMPDGYGRRRQALLGTYFEAAMRARRQAGRPRGVDPHMLIFVWMTLHEAGKVRRGPFDPGARTPAAAIAAECARQGRGSFSPEQVRKSVSSSVPRS
ncbi:hypothetical protein H1235_07945 [Pseudoxanthomonas sp. NC8]|nr:hypothetical protein H1235_07945 [Pseudoxanthomonas sp. NC8]